MELTSRGRAGWMPTLREASSEALVLEMPHGAEVLGTTVVGGEGRARNVAFLRVSSYVEDFAAYAASALRRLGLPEDTPAFLTAADVGSYVRAECGGEAGAVAYVTFGLSNPACLGEGARAGQSTINLFVAVDEPLSRAGLLDAFRTASEVKGALSSSLISCRRSLAVGTVSDATLVSAPAGSAPYAGLATPAGRAIACAVVRAFSEIGRRLGPRGRFEQYMGGLGLEEASSEVGACLGLPPGSIAESAEELLGDPGVEAAVRALRSMDLLGPSSYELAGALGLALASSAAGRSAQDLYGRALACSRALGLPPASGAAVAAVIAAAAARRGMVA